MNLNKRQRIPKVQSKMDNPEKLANKRWRIPMGPSKMENPEKLAIQGTQDEDQEIKTQHNICLSPLCTNNVNKT